MLKVFGVVHLAVNNYIPVCIPRETGITVIRLYVYRYFGIVTYTTYAYFFGKVYFVLGWNTSTLHV
jgi:hypothetical protein